MRKLSILALCLILLCACALAEGPAVEWTSGMPVLEEREMEFLLLANGEEPLAEDYVPPELIHVIKRKDDDQGRNSNGGIYVANSAKMQLVSEAANALTRLTEAAEADGVVLYLRQGYRSYADQQRLSARAKPGDRVQAPGACDFQTGLGCTLVGYNWRGMTLGPDFAQTEEAQWLAQNAVRFGFIIRYPEGKEDLTGNAWEPCQLRYVGSSKISGYMQRENLCLEEFVAGYRAAVAEYESRGGVMADLMQSVDLPDGPLVLDAVGPDGDHEITIFHD